MLSARIVAVTIFFAGLGKVLGYRANLIRLFNYKVHIIHHDSNNLIE